MQVMSKLTRNLMITALAFVGMLALTGIPRITSAEILVESYCQLSVQCMQQEISNFQELITLVNQYQDDRETLNQQEEIKKEEFARARDSLFLSFGITDTEYGTYMGSNGHAVDKYFEDNPSIKQQIDDLSAQANSLMEQYETLKGVEEEIPEEPSAME